MSKSTHLLWSYSRHKICGVIRNSGSSSPCKSNGMSQVEIQKSTSLIPSKLMKLTILFPLDWVSKVKSPWDEHICREFVDITSYQPVFWLNIWKKICKPMTNVRQNPPWQNTPATKSPMTKSPKFYESQKLGMTKSLATKSGIFPLKDFGPPPLSKVCKNHNMLYIDI